MISASRVNWACGLALAVAVALPLTSSRAASPSEKATDASAKSPDKSIADETAIAKVTGDKAAVDTNATEKSTVDLFDGMKSGDLEVKYIAKNSREGQLLVKNKTDQPLTVKLPEAFAAVPVLAQVAAAPAARANRSYGGGNNRNNQGNQGVGGGAGGIGGGGGLGGGGAFNVAPEKVAKLKVETVCLEHGKKEPAANVPYEIRPLESFTTDANVQELVKLVGTGQINQRAAQAAAWHLANHMTWEQLLDKKIHHLLGGDEVFFTEADIRTAMQLTDRAMKAADARQTGATASATAPDTTAISAGK